jgi:hypothetical protein
MSERVRPSVLVALRASVLRTAAAVARRRQLSRRHEHVSRRARAGGAVSRPVSKDTVSRNIKRDWEARNERDLSPEDVVRQDQWPAGPDSAAWSSRSCVERAAVRGHSKLESCEGRNGHGRTEIGNATDGGSIQLANLAPANEANPI